MRVLLAIKALGVPGGGAEKVLVDVANGLHRRGHEIRILTFEQPGPAFYDLLPEIGRVFVTPGAGRLGILRAVPRIRAVIKAERPDAMAAFMHSSYVPMALAGLGTGVPLVASEHTDAVHYRDRPLERGLRRVADYLSALRTVPSESARRSFLAADGSDSIVVPNPVAPLPQIPLPEDRIVLNVGSMRPEKDHAVLLDAFAQVAGAFPDWRLRLVGDGPQRAELEAQAARLGLGARVEMPGFTRDVGAAYAAARFLVLPSRYESFGMVAAEALSVGRAVLSFDDCGGIAEIVENGRNGLLVRGAPDRATRVAALAEGLRRLMGDPEFCARLGAAGPASVRQYGLEAVLDRWEDVLHRAAAPRAADRSMETGT